VERIHTAPLIPVAQNPDVLVDPQRIRPVAVFFGIRDEADLGPVRAAVVAMYQDKDPANEIGVYGIYFSDKKAANKRFNKLPKAKEDSPFILKGRLLLYIWKDDGVSDLACKAIRDYFRTAKFKPAHHVTAQDVDPPKDRTKVATILGKSIYSDSVVVSTEVNRQRKKLGEEEFDRWLQSHRGQRLFLAINVALLQQYATENGSVPTDNEIDAWIRHAQEATRGNDNAPKDPEPHEDKMLRLFAYGCIIDWKTSKALCEKYGGREGFGSLGACMAFDARTKLFREQHKAGKFRIHDPQLRTLFWHAAADEAYADTVLEGDRAKRFFERRPRWQADEQPERPKPVAAPNSRENASSPAR